MVSVVERRVLAANLGENVWRATRAMAVLMRDMSGCGNSSCPVGVRDDIKSTWARRFPHSDVMRLAMHPYYKGERSPPLTSHSAALIGWGPETKRRCHWLWTSASRCYALYAILLAECGPMDFSWSVIRSAVVPRPRARLCSETFGTKARSPKFNSLCPSFLLATTPGESFVEFQVFVVSFSRDGVTGSG